MMQSLRANLERCISCVAVGVKGERVARLSINTDKHSYSRQIFH